MNERKRRVLIVDDALFMRNFIKDILIKANFEICGEAENAVEGVEKYKELKPDLVTFDIMMPKMEELDGISAIKEICYFDPKAKIIVISALGDKKLIQQAIVYGAKEFITKPFTAKQLLEVIEKVFSSSQN